MDFKTKAKMQVLQELMDMMDSKMVDGLKSKSPKFMEVKTNDPQMAQDVVKNALEGKLEDDNEDPSKEMTAADFKEDLSEGEDPLHETDHSGMQDDDLEKLKELYARLK